MQKSKDNATIKHEKTLIRLLVRPKTVRLTFRPQSKRHSKFSMWRPFAFTQHSTDQQRRRWPFATHRTTPYSDVTSDPPRRVSGSCIPTPASVPRSCSTQDSNLCCLVATSLGR